MQSQFCHFTIINIVGYNLNRKFVYFCNAQVQKVQTDPVWTIFILRIDYSKVQKFKIVAKFIHMNEWNNRYRCSHVQCRSSIADTNKFVTIGRWLENLQLPEKTCAITHYSNTCKKNFLFDYNVHR